MLKKGILALVLLFGGAVAGHGANTLPKCLNTPDGLFEQKGKRMFCTIHHHFDDGGKMKENTLGLAKGVDFDMELNLDFSPKVLEQVFIKKVLTLPQQHLKARVHTAAGKLPVDFYLSPAIELDGKYPLKNLKAKDARLGLSRIKSPLLPRPLEKYLIKELNNNADLRQKLVEATNEGLTQFR